VKKLLPWSAVAIALLVGAFLARDALFGLGGGLGDADGAGGGPAPEAAGIEGRDAAGAMSGAPAGLASASVAGTGEVVVRLLHFPDRNPIVGQAVRLHAAGGPALERPTGDDGRVVFAGVAPGRGLRLTVEGSGFSPVEVTEIAVKANRRTEIEDLLLGEKVVLRGKVVDGKGSPVPGASVAAYTSVAPDLTRGMAAAMVADALTFPTPSEETKTDEKGLFALASISPGTYRLATKHPGYAMDVKADLLIAAGRAPGALTIVLGPGVTVRGRVTDDRGEAVGGAEVLVVEDPGPRATSLTLRKDRAVTGTDGRYAVETLIRGVTYRFGVSSKGIAPVFDTTGLTLDADLVRDFVVERGGAIAGTVSDAASGKPIAGANVVVLTGTLPMGGRGGRGPGGFGGRSSAPAASGPPSLLSTGTAVSASDGTFRIEGLRPGPVSLAQVKAVGYADHSAVQLPGGGAGGGGGMGAAFGVATPWGDVRAGDTLVVEAKLQAGGSVVGKVTTVTASGPAPVAGATVGIVSFASFLSGVPNAVSGEDGSYRIDGVRAPSQFSVIARAPGFVGSAPDFQNQTEMPAAGGLVTHDVVLSAAGTIVGTVVDAKGVPVPGARVRARVSPTGGRGGMGGFLRNLLPGGTGGTVLTDESGAFRIDDVASEERVFVEAESDEHVPAETETFDLKAGTTRDVRLVLLGPATLRGRVVDDRGHSVAGAVIRVGRIDEDTAKAAELSGWRADALLESRTLASDDEGWYEVGRVRPGKVLLKVEHPGHVTWYRRDLVVQADQVMENLTITMVKGETISGVVRGEDGRPAPGAMVAVTKSANPARGFAPAAPADPAAPVDGAVEPTMSDRADEQGRFTVENVPPGASYSVLVWFAPGFRGWSTGDEASIHRGVAAGARDVEFALKKAEAGANPFPMPPRPAGTPAGAPPIPRPPPSGGTVPVPVPGMGG
jgi:protocatechuate 3,4-dioxygenase beta subunit